MRRPKTTLSYDYDGAIEMIKSYQAMKGVIRFILPLWKQLRKLRLKRIVGPLQAHIPVRQFNHVFFHSLVAITVRPLTAL